MNRSTLTREALETHLWRRCCEDSSFRSDLTSRPRETIEREIAALTNGKATLPKALTVQIHQQEPGTLHLVIPPVPEDLLRADTDMILFWRQVLTART